VEKDRIVTLLLSILEQSLRLAHPFLPLITEEIYQKLPRHGEAVDSEHGDSIMTQPYPAADPARLDAAVEQKFASLQELVRAVRTIRSEFTIPPDRKIDVTVVTEKGAPAARAIYEESSTLIVHLAGIKTLAFQDARPAHAIAAAGKGFEVFVHVTEAIDAPKEITRLTKEKDRVRGEIQRTETKLATSSFVERAPKEVVDKEKEKLAELTRLVGKIDGYVAALEA
jgi:valyl-tRNA synthetase